MKIRLFIFSIILSCATASAVDFHYTFQSKTFDGIITTDTIGCFLNNHRFIVRAVGNNHSVNCQFIPGRGLQVVPKTNNSIFTIYTKTSNPTLSASITLDAIQTNYIAFTQPGINSTPDDTVFTGINTYSHTYTNNTAGPKIVITITDTIYIRSIQFSYSTPQGSNPVKINLHDENGTLTSSFSISSAPVTLQSITPTDSRFTFVGWTTSSSPINDSPTAPADLITSITTMPTNTTDLYPLFVHYRPQSVPEVLTFIPTNTTGVRVSHSFSPTSDILLTSLYYHIQGNTSKNSIKLSLNSSDQSFDTLIQQSKTTRFLELPVNSVFHASDNLTIAAHRLDDALTIDSIIAITYPNPEARYYSLLSSITSTNNLTIELTDDAPLTSTSIAIDAAIYSRTFDDQRFYFFSLPFDVSYDGISIIPISGPHPRTYVYGATSTAFLGDYLFSEYDETTNSWHDLTLAELTTNGLKANRGYTLGLTKTNAVATFSFRSSANNITLSTAQSAISLPTLFTYTNGDASNHGWNLLGNPYYTPLPTTNISAPYFLIPNNTSSDIHNPYVVVSPYAEENESNTTTSADIPPFAPFFIQTPLSSVNISPQTSSRPAVLAEEPIYHFNILCTTADSLQTALTILSHSSFTENYEIGSDLLSLTPRRSITHNGLAIYASSLSIGDTISLTLPSRNALLSLGSNIEIPEDWRISILPDIPAVTILDVNASALDDVDDTPNSDTSFMLYTLDGRLIFAGTALPTSPIPGLYILRTSRGKTQKILIR